MEYLYLLPIGAYLVGSIPFGLLLGRLKGLDVRGQGSGNIGATNVARLAGKGLGLLTLVCDLLKAVVPLLIVDRLLADSGQREYWLLLSGGAAFLGHLFPIYLGFRGGKGVATALGVFLYLSPWAALASLLIFVGVLANWGYVSLASLSAALLMPGLVWLFSGSPGKALLALLIGALIWWRHRQNIQRLLRGEENRVGGNK